MSDVKRSTGIWAISDGRAGNARQAEALAHALADILPIIHRVEVHHLTPHAPWRWFAPRKLPLAGHAFGPQFADAMRARPAIVIGCGRQAALATRLLRARGATAIQILDPRIAARHWDMLVVPEHDRLRGPNVLTLLGSLNPINDAWLAAGRAAFPALGTLPSPRIALLIGGPTAQVPWTTAAFDALLEQIVALLGEGGSVIATTSRRTPASVTEQLRRRLGALPGVIWSGEQDGPNPYAGMLGWADRIVCTADSVNLASEACASDVPVTVAFAEHASGRVTDFIAALQQRGRIGPLQPEATATSIVPLRETARVAAAIREHLIHTAAVTSDQ